MKTRLGVTLAMLLIAAVAAESQTRVYRLGFLGLSSPAAYAPNLQAFHQGLRDLGYAEGRNLSIDYRWAEGRLDRLPALAVELVRLTPDVLVTHAAPGIRAAQQATTTIPIVMGVSGDPVRLGHVKSLARPGGNTTGVASQIFDLSAKRLELLREAVPRLKQVAVLANLATETAREAVTETEAAGRTMGVRVRSIGAAEPAQLDGAFAAILRERPDALIVMPDSLVGRHNVRIAEFAAKHRLPTMGGESSFVPDGGLLSYGGDFREGWRVAARYVDRILKGASPAELPVEQPIKFTLGINLKTAKKLGLTIPPALLARADDVIQ